MPSFSENIRNLNVFLFTCHFKIDFQVHTLIRRCVTTGATGAMAPVNFWDSLVKGYIEGKKSSLDWSLAPVLLDS